MVRYWWLCCDDGGFHRLKRLSCHGDRVGILGGDWFGKEGNITYILVLRRNNTRFYVDQEWEVCLKLHCSPLWFSGSSGKSESLRTWT